VLPLKRGVRLALIGPHTQTQQDLAGNYFETIGLGTCAGPTCVPMLSTAFNAVNSGGAGGGGGNNATVTAGCLEMKCDSEFAAAGIVAAVKAARAAEAVVLALGIDGDVAGEGKDRMNITLPGKQKQLADAVVAVGRPTVVLLFSGGLIDIGDLTGHPNVAIIQAWFPGATGGTAVAETVFGLQNRFGKLPFTWYNSRFTATSAFDNMNMTDGPGRTYKYLKDPKACPTPPSSSRSRRSAAARPAARRCVSTRWTRRCCRLRSPSRTPASSRAMRWSSCSRSRMAQPWPGTPPARPAGAERPRRRCLPAS
jgi:hypothetical protein